jgi:hypothetical protein
VTAHPSGMVISWWISPMLCGVPVTAIDGEVHGGSDGVLHERVEPRWREHDTDELPSMRCGTIGPASCAELWGCFGTYSRRRESHWEGCHRRQPKGEK